MRLLFLVCFGRSLLSCTIVLIVGPASVSPWCYCLFIFSELSLVLWVSIPKQLAEVFQRFVLPFLVTFVVSRLFVLLYKFSLGWRCHAVFDVFRSLVVLACVLLMLVQCSCSFVGTGFSSFTALQLLICLRIMMISGIPGTFLLVHHSFSRRLLFFGFRSHQLCALFQDFLYWCGFDRRGEVCACFWDAQPCATIFLFFEPRFSCCFNTVFKPEHRETADSPENELTKVAYPNRGHYA